MENNNKQKCTISARIFYLLLIFTLASCAQLPEQKTVNNIVWLEQGWKSDERDRFHFESQGTMTIPVPYEWFIAFEQPGFNLFGEKGLVIENGYLSHFGFISTSPTQQNQAGLPVGFAVTYNTTNPAIGDGKVNGVGLTCAACHTGQMIVNDTSIRYDGGPAMSDLTGLISVLGLAAIETFIDENKFDRFAQRVLGIENTPAKRSELKKDLKQVIIRQVKGIIEPLKLKDAGLIEAIKEDLHHKKFISFIKDVRKLIHKKRDKPTKEGFARLDALNRIGNTVFGGDTGNYANVAVIQAPVNYPHLWNASWFRWVQYDASIMGPMIRNSGEAMGVAAYIKLDENAKNNFESSVPLDNLFWVETMLAGKTPPTKNRKFTGLQHPKWDEKLFNKIDKQKHAKGAKLYQEHCQGCHLAPFDSDEFWTHNWTPANKAGQSYLDLPIVSLDLLGTDPEEAKVLIDRKVDTRGIGLNTEVYVESYDWFANDPVYYGAKDDWCKKTVIKDGESQPFSVSLGAAVQEVNDAWYKSHNISKADQMKMNGYRKNCLRAPPAYKARPLNGIWATAPFLHNGSVPSIFDLLSPLAERPKTFYLGSLEYDIKNMGYNTEEKKGYTKIDTSIKGNSNAGHEFSNKQGKGVIGPLLSKEERYQIIEYLKDIRSVN